jgi:UDP-N-acetylmuramyl pentapeptide phosphotransferase/UDP-N-acetylglucosamine-1-phosphate transferase
MYTKQIVSLSLMVILVLCIALAVMHQGAAQSVGDAYTHGHAISHLHSTLALDDLDRMPATSAGPGSTRNDATGNTSQPRKISAPQPVSGEQIKYSLLVLLSAALIAWLSGYLIVRYEHLHAHLSHDHTDSGPQKYHAQPTPRIGGIALALGLLAAGGVMLVSNNQLPLTGYGLLLVAAIPAFAGGIVEDLTKKVGVLERLILTMLSAAAAAWLLDAILTQIEIPLLREALTWMPFAVAFTVFAVGGVANAINIIDGYNGLAPGYALITLAAIAWVAALVGDSLILIAALAMAGAVLGFFVWNWPKGKIFLGDAGAYLLGFWLGGTMRIAGRAQPGPRLRPLLPGPDDLPRVRDHLLHLPAQTAAKTKPRPAGQHALPPTGLQTPEPVPPRQPRPAGTHPPQQRRGAPLLADYRLVRPGLPVLLGPPRRPGGRYPHLLHGLRLGLLPPAEQDQGLRLGVVGPVNVDLGLAGCFFPSIPTPLAG